MSLIGQRWKRSNVCSWLILISRGLDLQLEQADSKRQPEIICEMKWPCSVFRVYPFVGEQSPKKLVLIGVWVHLFPSRTQKLSTPSPTILCGWLHGKIGNANTENLTRNREVFCCLKQSTGLFFNGRTILCLHGKIGNANTEKPTWEIKSDFFLFWEL